MKLFPIFFTLVVALLRGNVTTVDDAVLDIDMDDDETPVSSSGWYYTADGHTRP